MTPLELLGNYSLEITAKEIDKIHDAVGLFPKGTQISVPFLPGENFDMRFTAVKTLNELGFVPMPTLAARRFRTQTELESYLHRLSEICIDRVFVAAGDPPQPEGPFPEALSIIKSGVLQKYGIKHVGISGYPSGHPNIDPGTLRRSMIEKTAMLAKVNLDCSIVTQFHFNAEEILAWMKKIRTDGIIVPVRVGIAGPTEIERLIAFGERCGVRVPNDYDPTEVIEGLTKNYEPKMHGKMQLHFFSFGGVVETGKWIQDYSKKSVR